MSINKGLFTSNTDLWETPQDFFDCLNKEFGFDLDVCALPENAKCERYFTPEKDGLKQEWSGTVWCNPPYGREIVKWVKKAAESQSTVVMLVPARTDTAWFHDYIWEGGNPLHERAVEVRRPEKQCSVSINDCYLQEVT